MSFSFQEFDSFSSVIELNVTTTSSIPNENSFISSSLVTFPNTVFRGPTASNFPLIATPSVFKSVISDEGTDTGYHVNLESNPIHGTTMDFNSIYTTSDLHV
jgi:hypothetical protein